MASHKVEKHEDVMDASVQDIGVEERAAVNVPCYSATAEDGKIKTLTISPGRVQGLDEFHLWSHATRIPLHHVSSTPRANAKCHVSSEVVDTYMFKQALHSDSSSGAVRYSRHAILQRLFSTPSSSPSFPSHIFCMH
eukprot:gene12987-5349_t